MVTTRVVGGASDRAGCSRRHRFRRRTDINKIIYIYNKNKNSHKK